jgi:formiminotetrahydrofolate cyclodeaminase
MNNEQLQQLRKTFDMEKDSDSMVWDLLIQINEMSVGESIREFISDITKELADVEGKIQAVQKTYLMNLKDKESRKQCNQMMDLLRKDRDELRRTLRSETYKRLATDGR